MATVCPVPAVQAGSLEHVLFFLCFPAVLSLKHSVMTVLCLSSFSGRFRQIEVLTTVANEFIDLFSQVTGHSVQRISTTDQGNDDNHQSPLKDGFSLDRLRGAESRAQTLCI